MFQLDPLPGLDKVEDCVRVALAEAVARLLARMYYYDRYKSIYQMSDRKEMSMSLIHRTVDIMFVIHWAGLDSAEPVVRYEGYTPLITPSSLSMSGSEPANLDVTAKSRYYGFQGPRPLATLYTYERAPMESHDTDEGTQPSDPDDLDAMSYDNPVGYQSRSRDMRSDENTRTPRMRMAELKRPAELPVRYDIKKRRRGMFKLREW
ncbi:hypothetical protein IAU60_002439 [Kwoniella sp. DSM 27419]